MSEIQEQLRQALTMERYPRSAAYDPQCVVDNLMGHWLRWLEACDLAGRGFEPDATMLRADGDDLLGLTRVVARRPGSAQGHHPERVGAPQECADES
jgi:hypothetical protein